MGNFDIKSIKFLVAVIIVCIIFVAFLPFAYKNLSANNDVNNVPANEVTEVTEVVNDDNADNEVAENSDDTNSDASQDKSKKSDNVNNNDLSNPSEVITNTQMETEMIVNAIKLRADKKYESAVYEFQQIAKNTSDDVIKAKCYEEIAITNAILKRYASAISYAQQAYDTLPSTESAILLARLYHKTGNETKAQGYINDLLQRDFTEE